MPSSASRRLCASARERSEEHTSELQSRRDLVCRLLLEKKKTHRPRPARKTTASDHLAPIPSLHSTLTHPRLLLPLQTSLGTSSTSPGATFQPPSSLHHH